MKPGKCLLANVDKGEAKGKDECKERSKERSKDKSKRVVFRLTIFTLIAAVLLSLAAAGKPAHAAPGVADGTPTPPAPQAPAKLAGAESYTPGRAAVVWPWKQENPEPKARHLASQAPLSAKNGNDAISMAAVDPANNITGLGQMGGASFRVAVSDGYAYIGSGFRLTVLDVSNPAMLSVLGKTSSSWADEVLGITVRGNYVYVAAGNEGLRVVDVSDPHNPLEVGFYNTPGYAWDVFVSGSFAYVADGETGLQVIDVTTAYAPQFKGALDTPGTAMDVVISGSTAYVADEDQGLRVLDVSNPAAPTEVGFFKTASRAVGLAFSGAYVYVADDAAGLRIIDAANRSAPKEIGALDTPGNAYAVDINPVTNTAFVADSGAGLRAVDISTKTAPKEVGQFDVAGCYANDIKVAGSYAYLIDTAHGLRVLNITNPSELSQVFLFNSPAPTDIEVYNNYAYVPAGSAGLRVLDISNAAEPLESGFFDTPGYAYAVDVFVPEGSQKIYAAVADWDKGLRVIDVSKPTAPYEVGALDTSGMARDVEVLFPYAYVADDNGGLQIINLNVPANPQLSGTCSQQGCMPPGGSARGVSVAAKPDSNLVYAYVADGEKGLRLIDVSDPSNPSQVGFYDTPGEGNDVALSPTHAYAYVADGFSGGLQVVNVANPASLVSLGAYDTDGSVNALFSVRAADSSTPETGDYVFIADGQQGLRVVAMEPTSTSRPTLREKGFYDTRGWAGSLTVVGKRVYVADGEDGVWILEAPAAWVPHTISGRVMDDKGNPLPGATITAIGETSTQSDGNGYYTLTGLASKDYTISPSLPGYLFSPSSFSINLQDDLWNRNFTGTKSLGETYSASGKIVDAQGQPLSGVTITVLPAASGNASAAAAASQISTNELGEYTLQAAAGQEYTLMPEKPGYAFSPPTLLVVIPKPDRTQASNTASALQEIVAASVPLSASISGKISDEKNAPLSDVLVSTDCGVNASTAKDGTYQLSPPQGTNCTLTPIKNGVLFTPPQRQIQADGMIKDQNFQVNKNATALPGQVVDEAGKPLAGVNVVTDCGGNAVSEDDGAFLLNVNLQDQTRCKVMLSKTGFTFIPANWIVSLDSIDNESAPAIASKRFIALPNVISGRIIDKNGKALQGVNVALSSGETAISDAEGKYLFNLVAEGSNLLTPSLEGLAFSPPTLAVSVPTRKQFDFTAEPLTYSISGRVLDVQGSPIPGVAVSDADGHTSITDGNGVYTWTGLAGNFTLTPVKEGYTFIPAALPVLLPAQQGSEFGFLAQPLEFPVSGVVRDENGQPMAGVTLTSTSGRQSVTDATGAFSYNEKIGTLQITPQKEGYVFSPASQEVTIPTQGNPLNFIGTGKEYNLTGVVKEQDGSPLGEVVLLENGSEVTRTDRFGAFSLARKPGSFSFNLHKEGYTFAPQQLTFNLPPAGGSDGAQQSAVAAPLCPNFILNGSFERDEGWGLPSEKSQPAAVALVGFEQAYRGARVAALNPAEGAKNPSGHAFLRQKVNIPKNVTSAALRFMLYPFSHAKLDSKGDSQLVLILDQHQKEKERLANLHSDERQWKSYQVDVSKYAGQTIWIYFGTYNNGKDGVAGLYVDDVSLQICEK